MRRSIVIARWALAVYCVAIVLLSILKLNGTASLSQSKVAGFRSDYLLHVLIFVPFMLLSKWSLSCLERKNNWFWSALVAGVVLAVFSESIQWFLPYRTFNPFDLLANGAGIILGGLIEVLTRVINDGKNERWDQRIK